MNIESTDQMPTRNTHDQDFETGTSHSSKTSRLVAHMAALPFVVHVVAVSITLLILLPIVHPGGTWTSDEGAIRAQVEFLQDGGSWSAERPFADLDPEGVTSPIHASTVDGDRYSPYTKHPLLPTLLGPFRSFLDDWALVLPALLGTIVAATVGATIAGLIDRRVRVLSLWVLAIASPLFFYGYTVLGHTIATALGALAVLVVMRFRDKPSSMWLVAIVSVFAATLLRAEALAFGAALGLAILIVDSASRRLTRLPLAVGLVAGAVAGMVVNDRWAIAVGGVEPVSEGQGILDAFRFVSGAFSSLVLVDFGTPRMLFVVVAMTGSAAVAAVLASRFPERVSVFNVAVGLSIFGSVGLILLAPVPIGGLLAASPILMAGLVVLRRLDRFRYEIRLILVTSIIFVGAVFLTQERGGGGAQWGGRYLMFVVPLLFPVAMAALAKVDIEPQRFRGLVSMLAIASLVLTMNAVLVLRTGREKTAALSGRLVELAFDDSQDEPLVIVSSGTHLGRQAWRTISDIDYFLIPDEQFDEYVVRLVDDGRARFAVVGPWTDRRAALFDSLGYSREPGSVEPFIVVSASSGS